MSFSFGGASTTAATPSKGTVGGGFSLGGAASPLSPPPLAASAAGRRNARETGTEEGEGEGATPAAATWASLAHSYAQLLDVLEKPSEHNVSPKEMGDLLSSLSPHFLSPLSSFRPASAASLSAVSTGSVQSSFPDAEGHHPNQQLDEEWRTLIRHFSQNMHLDAIQSYHLIETYLHLYRSNNAAQLINSAAAAAATSFSGAARLSSLGDASLSLHELVHFYYSERCSLLQCLSALFRIYIDDGHLYHQQAVTLLRKLCDEGLEEQLINKLKETCAVQMPRPVTQANGLPPKQKNGEEEARLLLEDPALAAKFADQNVEEQYLLLELLFLLCYELDEFIPLDEASSPSTKTSLTPSARVGQTRLLHIYSLLHSCHFGRAQPLYTYLSPTGRARVESLGQLGMLVAIELMTLEKLLRVYNHPLQDVKAYLQARRSGGGVKDMEEWERQREAARVILEESDLTFRQHPFSDLSFLAQLDQQFFEVDWNPMHASQPSAPVELYAPINLAWSVALSQLYEYLEDVQLIRQQFDLQEDGSEGRKTLDLEDYDSEKQIILTRLSSSFSRHNPFEVLVRVLAGVEQRQADEAASSILPALKEIVHELLKALFQSTCYSALLSMGGGPGGPLSPLFPLFNLIFHEESHLCYRFWAQDDEHPEDRPSLLEQAIQLFPHDSNPFINMLTALAGKTVAPELNLRFDAMGQELELATSNGVEADSRVCANRVFDSLDNMKSYSSIMPPAHLTQALEGQEEYNLMLLRDWHTPDGMVLPARTVGRVLNSNASPDGPQLVQWFLAYSAWPLLLQRVEGAWKKLRAAQPLSTKEWIEITNILHLTSKIVRADQELYAQLHARLQESAAGVNECSLILYAPNDTNATFSRGTQRELNLLVLLLRLQSFVSLHAPSILASAQSAAANSHSTVNSTTAPLNATRQSFVGMDTTMDVSQLLTTPPSVQLTPEHLLTLGEACGHLLQAGAKQDMQRWLKAYTLVLGREASSPNSPLHAALTSAHLPPSSSTSRMAMATYNQVHLLQRSWESLQAPLGRFHTHITFLHQLTSLILPLYQLASIQQLRVHARAQAPSFLPPSLQPANAATTTPSSLPLNTSLSPFLSTFDLHHLLNYVCECMFIRYEEWTYEHRSLRWVMGSHILRFFIVILANPSAPVVLPEDGQAASTTSSPLHSLSLQHYLYSLFLTQPTMLLALLRPLLFGQSLLDRLNYDRGHDVEVDRLQDLLVHTLLVLQTLMNMESQKASVSALVPQGQTTSFYRVLLEAVSATATPTAWRYQARRRGKREMATAGSLLHAIAEFVNYTHCTELQCLAVQTIRLLCGGGEQNKGTTNDLAAHFNPATLILFRGSCLQLLTAHATDLSLKLHVLQLLATLFEKQPAMAQQFASTPVAPAEGDETEEESDSLFDVLRAYLVDSENLFRSDPHCLHLVLRIVAAVWRAAAARTIGRGELLTLQKRLRQEVPNFWQKITYAITAEEPHTQLDKDLNDTAAFWEALPTDSAAFTHHLSVTHLRQTVWSLLNTELFQSLCMSPSATLDKGLESVLNSWAASSAQPHRYIQMMQEYCNISERVNLQRQTLTQLQEYGLDLTLFTSLPSVEQVEEGINCPLYDLDSLGKVLQLDVDVAFEREEEEKERGALNQSRFGGLNDNESLSTSTSTALVLAEKKVDALTQRHNAEELLLQLRQLNGSLILADADMALLQSWSCFMQICLHKQPQLIGIQSKSALAWEYVHELSTLLANKEQSKQGEVGAVFLQQLSSLLLSFLTAALTSSSLEVDLSTAILLSVSRQRYHLNMGSSSLPDEEADGERVFRASNQLLAQLANTLLLASKPAATTPTADMADDSQPEPMPDTRARDFNPLSKISEGWMGKRAAAAMEGVTASPAAGPVTPALSYLHHLTTSTLLLLRWTNQQLLTRVSRQSSEQNTSPVLRARRGVAPARDPSRLFSPAKDGHKGLAPVLEQEQSSTELASAVGTDYARTCLTLLQAMGGCVAYGATRETAITALPLLLQAIDIVQGAQVKQQQKQKGAEAETINWGEEEPVNQALSLLRPMLPILLREFASIPLSQPGIALKLVQLFCVIAEYEQGAALLVQHSLLLYICSHRVFNPQSDTPPMESAGGVQYGGDYFPSFSPYTPSQARDPWHQVWLLCLRLISTLLRSLQSPSARSMARNGHSLGAKPSPPTPVQSQLSEQVLRFFNLFSGARLNKVLHLAHLSHLSVGSLEEVEAITHLLYEYETYAALWHSSNPSLHTLHKQQVLLLVTYYMRLLNDPRELEKRILVVTPEEKADAHDPDSNGAGEEEALEPAAAGGNVGFASPLGRQTSTFNLAGEEARGGPVEKPTLTAVIGMGAEEKKGLDALKKVWRPLGAASGISSGASTPRQLSTPTTPRSLSTPSVHTPGAEERELSRNNLNVNVSLTPVQGNSRSFLLRSPVVGPMVNRSVEAENGPAIGTGFMSGAQAAEAQQAAANAHPQKGFAFFLQRIELSMLLILRNCLSYLRLLCTDADYPRSMRAVLFSHRVKLSHLLTNSSLLPQLGGASQPVGGGLMLMLANGLQTGAAVAAPHHTHVGLTSRDKIQQAFAGLGVGIEEEEQLSPAEVELEQEYWEMSEETARSPSSRSSLTYRPPLAMLFDFEQYVLREFSRLFEIEKASGMLESMLEERTDSEERRAWRDRHLPHSKFVFSGSAASAVSSAVGPFSPASPSLRSLHTLLQFLLENSLLLLVQHVQLHVQRLKKLQAEYLALKPTPPVSQLLAAAAPYAYAPETAQPVAPAVHPFATRLTKQLEQYRERLNSLLDLLSRYQQLLSAQEPAPPSLTAAPAAAHTLSPLLLQLMETMEEESKGLREHAFAFHKHVTQMQQQQQQQQQQTQYYMQP